MSDNSITIKVSLSDDLLNKVAGLLAPPTPARPMGIPAALLPALMGAGVATPKESEKPAEEKPTIGFKADK